jgi:hypothetical protein
LHGIHDTPPLCVYVELIFGINPTATALHSQASSPLLCCRQVFFQL